MLLGLRNRLSHFELIPGSLRNRANQANRLGRAVFVHEHFLDDTRDGPFFPAFLNLNMLVAAHGKERTAAEYEAWLQEAGFARTQSWKGNSPRGFVLGFKP